MASSDSDRYWLSSENSTSGRTAIVADEGDSVWFYLTHASSAKIFADCWLFNRIVAPDAEELSTKAAEYRDRGEPPPATSDVVDERARLSGELDDSRVRLAWSADGEAVVAWVDGAPVGFITSDVSRGRSVHLRAECPRGAPFDIELYDRLFGAP